MTQITLAELPETVQNLINQAKKTGETLTITQNGIPFATISPIKKKSILKVFANWDDIDEEFPNVDEGLLPLDDIELSPRSQRLAGNVILEAPVRDKGKRKTEKEPPVRVSR